MHTIFQKYGLAIAATALMFTGCTKDKEPAIVIPTFSPGVVSVQSGDPAEAAITAGTAPFTVQNITPSNIVSATIEGNTVKIIGIAKGDAVVTVSGKDGGQANLGVVVTERPASAPTLSTSAVEIDEAGLTATVTITGGTPAYTVTSAHPNIASVVLNGVTITVKGESMGTTLITVKGSDNASSTFAVNVGGEQIFFGANRTQIGNGNKSFYIEGKHTLRKGVYTMVGWVYIADGAELTIEPGTIIKCSDYNWNGDKSATGTSLVVKMGGKIYADGTREEPIVFTSAKPKGQRQATDWGGIIICGKARNNQGLMMIEGGVDAPHGGDDDNDNSGVLRFVRLEFGGYPYALDNEINGLTMGSVGRGTTIEYIQVSYCGDDSFEWFGGSVNGRYLVAYHGWDDDFDTDNGYSGKLQFLLGVRDPKIGDQSNSNGFESDNNASGSTETPFTTAVFSNVTIIGPMGQDPNFNNYDILYPQGSLPASLTPYITGYNWGNTTEAAFPIRTGIFQCAMQIRRNSRMNCFNSVLTGYPVGIMLSNDGRGDTQGAAADGLLAVRNVFLAGMGMTGADVNNNRNTWSGTISRDYFLQPHLNNTVYEPENQSYEAIVASIQKLKLNQFQSKKIPLTAMTTGGIQSADNNPTANWGPMAGSPLLGAADFSHPFLNDPFFTKVTYAGAFAGDSEADNWMRGWTNFDPQNTDY